MKTFKIFLTIVVISMSFMSSMITYAHSDLLNIEYDNCQPDYWDGENEIWYFLEKDATIEVLEMKYSFQWYYHISHEITTIKYYFADNLDGYYWDTDVSSEEAQYVKDMYLKSMKMWANIYYYTYDQSGNSSTNRVINLVPGTSTDYNVIIYPVSSANAIYNGTPYLALTGPLYIPELDSFDIIEHSHYGKWEMKVNVEDLYFDTTANEYVGAHELGHVLGLRDADICCDSVKITHHGELLMGYSSPVSTYAKYKDIAGVAITRGFHTDDDHVWMLRSNTDGTKDVICAQCNGVRYNIALTDGKYEGKTVNPYQSCIHHGGTNEKMLLVATDGERNFFKCQYCRRIETVDLSDNVVLDPYAPIDISRNVYGHDNKYIKITVNHRDTYTFKATPIDGLSVMLYDSNLNSVDLVIDDVFTSEGSDVYLDIGTYYLRIDNSKSSSITAEMTVSPPPHTHEYTQWKFLSDTHHIEQCECGQVGHATGYHVIEGGTGAVLRGKCIYCKSMIFLGNNTFPGIMSMMKYSVNGSYILPNGIIVLVDEDIEAYLNGTLVFYDKDNLPVVQ